MNKENQEKSAQDQISNDNAFDIESLMKNIDMSSLMNNLDLKSLMNMTSNLLKDESLVNTTKALGTSTQSPLLNLLNVSDKKESEEFASVSEKLENLANELSELKKESEEFVSVSAKLESLVNELSELKNELLGLKEQNKYLTKLIKKLLDSDYKKKNK